jgi:hypothetical protein
MTEEQLRHEHKVTYETRLGIMEVWGVPSAFEHNTAVEEANEHDRQLRKDNGMVQKLREFRESL